MIISPKELLRTCEKSAYVGGIIVRSSRNSQWREKGPRDLVTSADLASEEAIRETIKAAFSDHAIIGEELSSTDGKTGYQWIIDPLDGTTNYVHCIPHYCVSVAVSFLGQLIAGAVYDPVARICFSAAQSLGAFQNGVALVTSEVRQLRDALVAIDLPANPQCDSPDLLQLVRISKDFQSVRSYGSTALNLCWLARGWLDVVWSSSAPPWDFAAGILIAREAGAEVSFGKQNLLDIDTRGFLATATLALHRQCAPLFEREFPKR